MAEEKPEGEGGDTAVADGGEPEELPPPEPIGPDTLAAHLKIAAAFRVFDHENNNTIDAREFGTVIRSLGLCPSEADLNTLLLECEDEDASGFIKYERLEPVLTRALIEKQFTSATEDELLEAFKTLDTEGVGNLTEEQLQKLMCDEGEGLNPEEFEEMIAAAKDLEKGVIYYEDYVPQLALETRVS
eukprot:m.14478 g.14478  ORF g.14478 m.14478 type:complete len:187 (-) comp5107_c0_seq1:315-875(-)